MGGVVHLSFNMMNSVEAFPYLGRLQFEKFIGEDCVRGIIGGIFRFFKLENRELANCLYWAHWLHYLLERHAVLHENFEDLR
jgi:hypothetical protein